MRAVTYYEMTEVEQRLLTDYYLPLHHLCTNTEQAEQVARFVNGNVKHYSREQAGMTILAVSDLRDVVWHQASTAHWSALGMPEPKALADMRSNESLRLNELLSSLNHIMTEAA